MAAALGYRPDGTAARLCFHLQQPSYNSGRLIGVLERLPAYAPELNPVEFLWANLKDVELANRPTTSLAEVADQAQHGIQRVCDSDTLVIGFLAHTGLSIDDDPSP